MVNVLVPAVDASDDHLEPDGNSTILYLFVYLLFVSCLYIFVYLSLSCAYICNIINRENIHFHVNTHSSCCYHYSYVT